SHLRCRFFFALNHMTKDSNSSWINSVFFSRFDNNSGSKIVNAVPSSLNTGRSPIKVLSVPKTMGIMRGEYEITVFDTVLGRLGARIDAVLRSGNQKCRFSP